MSCSSRDCFRALGMVLFTTLLAAVPGGVQAAAPVRLTDNGTMKFVTAFAGDGSDVLFVEFVKPTLFQIMRLKLDDRSVEPLHENQTDHELDIAVSPDGRYYAFVKCHGTLHGAIEIRDVSQKSIGHVPAAPGFAVYRSLAFAPDNSRLLFTFPENVHRQIFSVSLKGDDRNQLTDTNGINNWPCFSPDGKQIVFASTRDGHYEIYKMQADGTGACRLTNSPTMDLRPQFSPSGLRISFTSNRDGNYEVYVMDSDGGNVQQVTSHPERDDYSVWHPSGKQLLMVSERNGHHDLYLVDAPP